MRNHPEWRFQEAAYAYFRKAFPPHALIWGADRGVGRKTQNQRAGETRRGIIAGIHDLFVFCDKELMTFECKAGKNGTTEAQDEFAARVERNGGRSVVCWTLEDIEAGMRGFGFEPIAKLTATERDALLAAPKPTRKYKARTERPSAARVRKVQAVLGRVGR